MYSGEAAGEPTLALIGPLRRSEYLLRAAICPQISRSRQLASSGRECSEISWGCVVPRGQLPALQTRPKWHRGSKANPKNSRVRSRGVGGRTIARSRRKKIDRFRFEEYGEVVRVRSQLEETRGLASVDRNNGCVIRVQDWCRWGRANDSRSHGQLGRLRGRGAGGLPGPGSFQNAHGAREEFSRVAADSAASSIPDVNRCTAVVSESPRRRSVGHASRSQSALLRRGSREFRSVTPATARACPVGGPGGTRRLGEPEFRLCAPDSGASSRHHPRCQIAIPQSPPHCKRAALRRGHSNERGYPACPRHLLFSGILPGSTRSRRVAIRPSGGPIGWSHQFGVSRGRGDRGFPAHVISGQQPCAMFG